MLALKFMQERQTDGGRHSDIDTEVNILEVEDLWHELDPLLASFFFLIDLTGKFILMRSLTPIREV